MGDQIKARHYVSDSTDLLDVNQTHKVQLSQARVTLYMCYTFRISDKAEEGYRRVLDGGVGVVRPCRVCLVCDVPVIEHGCLILHE